MRARIKNHITRFGRPGSDAVVGDGQTVIVPEGDQPPRTNPALAMALQQHANPYEFAYPEATRVQMLKEVGDDPVAYRAKVEAEVRASLQQPATTAPLNLPASLAGARSSAPRTAPAFTGPAPIGSLFNN